MVVVLTKCGAWCVRVCRCVCVSGSAIGAAGGTAVAEALKVNTSVQEIDLSSEWCFSWVSDVALVLTPSVCVCVRQ